MGFLPFFPEGKLVIKIKNIEKLTERFGKNESTHLHLHDMFLKDEAGNSYLVLRMQRNKPYFLLNGRPLVLPFLVWNGKVAKSDYF